MKNSEYWKLCFAQLEESQNEIASNSRAEIERQYRQAAKEIEGKIDTWYRKLGANGISMAEASKPLSDSELADFKWDVYDYIKYGEENALSGQWIKQLENILNQPYISKYDELRVHTQQSLESLFAKQYGITTETMKKVYQSGYYHTAFEIQRGFGVGWDIAGIERDRLEKVIAKPWVADGKNFSERIWINKQGLISEVDDQLTQHIIRGDNPQRAIDAIVNNMNVYKSNAGRIVMTEGAYFGSAAQRECFEELGVEEYEIIATMDKHTSEICRGHDGKRFPVKEYRVGVTAPPFHPWCRSTTCPCFEGDFGERTGSCRISEDISYVEWKERFVEGGDKMRFAAVDKSGKSGIINMGDSSWDIN